MLTLSEKYVSGMMLNAVLCPCWDSFHFVNHAEICREMDYQNKVLHPKVEESFEQLRNAEKKLAA